MKKLILSTIALPIFIILFMNFIGDETDQNHNYDARSFTCTSCHASIIDGIIISGKLDPDGIMSQVDITLPNTDLNSVVINIGSEENENVNINTGAPEFVLADKFGVLLSFDANNGKGKKENNISIQHKITAFEKENGFIELQGVLSNLDGALTSDFAFYKKIAIADMSETKALKLFPSIASNFVSIENTSAAESLQIFDIQGKIILNTFTEEGKTNIDLSTFQNGNYFAIVGNGKDKFQSRFIVSK